MDGPLLLRARTFLSATKIRLLREKKERENVDTELKAAQNEEAESLTKRLRISEMQNKAHLLADADLIRVKIEFLNSQLDAAAKPEERIAVLMKLVKHAAPTLYHGAEAEYKEGHGLIDF